LDLNHLGRVVWRFKWIVLLGLILAFGLTFLAMFRVTRDGKISYRQSQQWASYSQIFVTQSGFPWGQLRPTGPNDSGRFVSLALIYAGLVDSDPVRQLMAKMGPPIVGGSVQASALLTAPGSSDALPIISIAGLATSKEDSVTLTSRATTALVQYIRAQQASSGTTAANRVIPQVIQTAGSSRVLAGRSKTVPVMVFIAVLTLVLAFVFVLENVRPRVRALETPPASTQSRVSQKLTA
jgi:hypothetical protein